MCMRSVVMSVVRFLKIDTIALWFQPPSCWTLIGYLLLLLFAVGNIEISLSNSEEFSSEAHHLSLLIETVFCF